MTEEQTEARVFLIKTPVKEFRCNEVKAKYYAHCEAVKEDVVLEVFEITKQKNGKEKKTKVNASEI